MTGLTPEDNELITTVARGDHPALLVAEPAIGVAPPAELNRGT
jgi:hypothetical protein